MSLRETNPLIDQDLTNIISAYTAGVNIQDTEESVYPVFMLEIIETKSFAKTVINQLNSYSEKGTNSPSAPSFKFAGLEIQNTVATIADADSVGDALKTAAADCIPCKDRILALLNLNPLDELLDLLENDLSKRLQMLFSFLDLLNNINIFNDICQLFRQLNFFCVPDLQRIALLLTLLLGKYKDKLTADIALPETLIGGLFAPFLMGLNGLLDQYVQTIIAPIECIIDELNYQIQKLDIGEGIAKGKNILNKENPKSTKGWIPDVSGPLKESISKPLEGALSSLTNYLEQGKAYVDSSLVFLQEQLMKLLDTKYVNTQIKISAAQNKLHLLRLISLVISIIDATKSGSFDCGDLEKADASKKLETFLKNYIDPNSAIRFNFDKSKQKVTIQSPAINNTQSTNIAEVLKNSRKTQALPFPSGSRIVDGQVIHQGVTILIKNCLRDIDQQDIDKVQEWISKFERGNID